MPERPHLNTSDLTYRGPGHAVPRPRRAGWVPARGRWERAGRPVTALDGPRRGSRAMAAGKRHAAAGVRWRRRPRPARAATGRAVGPGRAAQRTRRTPRLVDPAAVLGLQRLGQALDLLAGERRQHAPHLEQAAVEQAPAAALADAGDHAREGRGGAPRAAEADGLGAVGDVEVEAVGRGVEPVGHVAEEQVALGPRTPIQTSRRRAIWRRIRAGRSRGRSRTHRRCCSRWEGTQGRQLQPSERVTRGRCGAWVPGPVATDRSYHRGPLCGFSMLLDED